VIAFLAICGALFFGASLVDAIRSPEFKRDLERMREMRRARQAARRS